MDNEEYAELFEEHRLFEAAMCAVLTQLETEKTPDEFKRFLKDINWQEAGVSKSMLKKWWTEHKARDVFRRFDEAAEREEQQGCNKFIEQRREAGAPEKLIEQEAREFIARQRQADTRLKLIKRDVREFIEQRSKAGVHLKVIEQEAQDLYAQLRKAAEQHTKSE